MHSKILTIIIIFLVFISAGNVSAAVTDSLGDSVQFFVDRDYDESNRDRITATLRNVNESAYVYVENEYFNALDAVEQENFLSAQDNIAQEFASVIYPKLTNFYGSEWNPGIDDDKKITLLFTPMQENAGGYFRTNDENKRSNIADSNEREMIYFNSQHIANSRAKSLIAHEFHHLINFYQKDKLQNINEEVWLNEMRSEYAPTAIGYDDDYNTSNTRYREKFFLATPNDPFVEWKGESEDYGVINFFAQYLADQYGKDIFASMIKNEEIGIRSINKSLKDSGFDATFGEIFSDWTIANIVNDCTVGQGKYCYKNSNLSDIKIEPTTTYNILNPYTSISVGETIDDWSARWYKFSGADLSEKAIRLQFKGAAENGSFRVPYIVESKNNEKNIKYLTLTNNEGAGFIKDFGNSIKSVTIIPSGHYINSGSNSNNKSPNKSFTLTADILDSSDVPDEAEINPTPRLDLPDGSLVRGRGDYRVYIIQGGYKRHILDGKIFDFYGHLSWENINEVDPVILAGYTESFLVRAAEDKKVYEINGDKTKHWLNMSAESFSTSGRKWDSISIINESERDFYTTGADVVL